MKKTKKIVMQRRFLFIGLFTSLTAAAIIAVNLDRVLQGAFPHTSELVGGEFSLLNHNAQPITEKDILGNYTLIFFGYTYCPDVCPTVLQTISVCLDLLDKSAKDILPIFITIDPERDTSEVLKSYLKNFHPLITGLTGSDEQVKKVAKAYGVYYAKAKDDRNLIDDYLLDHSGGIYLMGPDGKFITRFSHSKSPEEITKKIKGYL